MDSSRSPTTPMTLSVMVCGIAMIPYVYDYFLQISPAVMSDTIMRDFKVDAVGLANISAFFYFAYTPMQIFAGLLLDRFGPRRLLTVAVLFCAIGTFAYSLTTSVLVASLGRFLVGLGSAFTFISSLLLISRWFRPEYFAMIAGITQLMGSVGAIVGGAPLALANEHFGWRHAMFESASFGMLLALVIWLVVRDHPKDARIFFKKSKLVRRNEWSKLREVLGQSQTWLIGLYSFMIWGPVVIFAALWGVLFLKAKYGLDDSQAGAAISLIWLGIGIGSPIMGWFSDKIRRRCFPLSLCAIIGCLSAIVVIYSPHVSIPITCLALFMFGFAASGQSLAFGLVRDNNHPDVAGTAIGFNNMAVVAGGALLQPMVGKFLQLHWTGTIVNDIPIYTLANYQAALITVPSCFLIAWLMSGSLIKETFCVTIQGSHPHEG